MLKRMLANAGADDTESADNRRATLSDIRLAGNVIKMDPAALGIFYDALCTQNKAVFFTIAQRRQSRCKLVARELLCGFNAPGSKYFISMVVTMIMTAATVLIMMMVMLVIVTATTVLIVVMMVLMVMAAIAVLIMMMVLMVMAAAAMPIMMML